MCAPLYMCWGLFHRASILSCVVHLAHITRVIYREELFCYRIQHIYNTFTKLAVKRREALDGVAILLAVAACTRVLSRVCGVCFLLLSKLRRKTRHPRERDAMFIIYLLHVVCKL